MTKQRENGITWTEETWNPIRGCSRISKGCMNCYAEGVANRFKGEGQPYEGLIASTGQWNGTVKMIDHMLAQPLRWQRPRLIFVNSMSDLFHESLTDEQIDRIFVVMAIASHHTFQVLTKRAERMAKYFRDVSLERLVESCRDEARGVSVIPYYSVSQIRQRFGLPDVARYKDPVEWPLKNVWLGVSVEDQEAANTRVPWLLECPAAVHWVSVEPMLGAVDLTRVIYPGLEQKSELHPYVAYDTLRGHMIGPDDVGLAKLDWVVVGGESGSGARPMHEDWAISLRDQCVKAGVPFHFKQYGEWKPSTPQHSLLGEFVEVVGECKFAKEPQHFKWPDGAISFRIGKKASGRVLGGRTWDEYPVGYEKVGAS